MDSTVYQYTASVQFRVVSPLGWLEWEVFLQLHQSKSPQVSALHHIFGRSHRRHEAVVFGHHQVYMRIGGYGDNCLCLLSGACQGLLEQDVLARSSGQAGVL